jgi:SPP1 family predicted phage head-tail adaptor
MIAREYTKRIDIYQGTEASDGFGGNTVSYELIASSWAKLVNPSSSRFTDLGLSDLSDSLLFKVRFRGELNYNGRNLYLNYNGDTYVIQSITDLDMVHRELDILCTKANPEIILPVVSLQSLPYTLPFTFSS